MRFLLIASLLICLVNKGMALGSKTTRAGFTPYWSIRQDVGRIFFSTLAFEVEFHRFADWSFVGGVLITYRSTTDITALLGSRPVSSVQQNVDRATLSGVGATLGARYFLKHFTQTGGIFAFMDGMYRTVAVLEKDYEYVIGQPPVLIDSYRYSFGVGRIASGMGISFHIGRFMLSSTLGGGLRLARYAGATEFTNDSRVKHLDYSGIFPTGSITMGIVFGKNL